MTQAESNERDARRYRIMRALVCAPEHTQREVHASIAHLLTPGAALQPQQIDRAMDHVLNTYKIV